MNKFEYKLEKPIVPARELHPEDLKQLSPDQRQCLATIANNLSGKNYHLLHTDKIFAELQRLGFTIWALELEHDDTTGFIKKVSQVTLMETGGIPLTDPFKPVLDEAYKTVPLPERERYLTEGGRGGYSFNEIDQFLLPQLARKIGMERYRVRLPTQQERLLTANKDEMDPNVLEWFSDVKEQPLTGEIATLMKSVRFLVSNYWNLSDDTADGLHDEYGHLSSLLSAKKEQDQKIATLRGNAQNAEFVSSDDHVPNSYFRCLVDLGRLGTELEAKDYWEEIRIRVASLLKAHTNEK